MLTITSESSNDQPTEIRVYPVADLAIIPLSLISGGGGGMGGRMGGMGGGMGGMGGGMGGMGGGMGGMGGGMGGMGGGMGMMSIPPLAQDDNPTDPQPACAGNGTTATDGVPSVRSGLDRERRARGGPDLQVKRDQPPSSAG
jgi:hypothetical protein